jgi:hypothetical protein
MRGLWGLVIVAAALAETPNTLERRELDDGWILLFDGRTLFGWQPVGEASWRVQEGVLIGDGEGAGGLRTTSAFGKYTFHCQFRTGGRPLEARTDDYQLPNGKKFETGRWHSYDVYNAAGGFTVLMDDERIAGGREAADAVGPLELPHPAGSRVEYRDVKLLPLGLAPLFDGKSMQGWRVVETPGAAHQAKWLVEGGALRVLHGPGQIETRRQFADFVMQVEVRVNSTDGRHHPDAGISFRGAPGGPWSGYETQIRNEWRGQNRAQPVEFGTGGLFNLQPARRVDGNDNEWFRMTIAARGRHVTVWVNGFAVTDWQERASAGRLPSGVISLQAHEPGSDIEFRNVHIAELPRQSKQP